jgi:hypothetical protein
MTCPLSSIAVNVTLSKTPSCAATGKKLLSKMQMLKTVKLKVPSVIHLLRKSKRKILRSASINTFIKVYSYSKEIWWPQRLLSPICVQMFFQSVFEL